MGNYKAHFIAIGGSAMHNLAIALSRKGIAVTGSDDEVFEPSCSRLEREGLLPEKMGWFPEKITSELSAVILGMHAHADNPELAKAKELGIPIFSYPEYLYEQSKDKTRIVIGGSHGKTTITSMILHVCKALNLDVDYMVGAQLEGYDCMVRLSESAKFIILEGDEYLSSPIDRRPKFHLYQPNIALLSGIAWDHINVFPTFENYVEQFKIFTDLIPSDGALIYNEEDIEVRKLAELSSSRIETISYQTPQFELTENETIVTWKEQRYSLAIFGSHNLQNMIGAMRVCEKMGVSNHDFLSALSTFTGAGKRLQLVGEKGDFICYKDFAHSPSKLKATTQAVKEKYPNRKLVACMELHTYSSLKKEFLPQYEGAMDKADVALVYFNHEVVAHKRLSPIDKAMVESGFGEGVKAYDNRDELLKFLKTENWKNSVLLLMSSGTFDGVDYRVLFDELAN
jgi:UDP-N-acetylmuramate: L-alanyl-gamma-D-glutamyl-meso-diaminopimelate ligase